MNKRNVTTNELLADSFKSLIEKKTIEKVTIKEITDGAGVIRPTFYNHFQDKYELIEWIISAHVLEPAMAPLQNGQYREALFLSLSNIEKEKNLFSKLVKLDVPVSYEMIMTNAITGFIKEVFPYKDRTYQMHIKYVSPEMFDEYYAFIFCYWIKKWVLYNFNLTPSDMAELCIKLLDNSMIDLMR